MNLIGKILCKLWMHSFTFTYAYGDLAEIRCRRCGIWGLVDAGGRMVKLNKADTDA